MTNDGATKAILTLLAAVCAYYLIAMLWVSDWEGRAAVAVMVAMLPVGGWCLWVALGWFATKG